MFGDDEDRIIRHRRAYGVDNDMDDLASPGGVATMYHGAIRGSQTILWRFKWFRAEGSPWE